MIYTVTLNTSIDYHVWLQTLTPNSIHQALKEWKSAGGKGINVSKVLRNLEQPSVALGFVGGFTGAFIRQELEREGIVHQLISIAEDSRINIKIKAGAETDISGVSPYIPSEAQDQLLGQLDLLTREDVLVLAGSVPASMPADFYGMTMQRLRPQGVRVILDAKGMALAHALPERPFLIKPNQHELGELFGVQVTTCEEAVHYARKALDMGASNVIVTLGGNGAVFVSPETELVAQFPKQQAINSIGAGDSVVAGFLYGVSLDWKIKDAFRFAVAAGCSTAIAEGFCTREHVDAFLPQITLIER
ncbi:1-phosphofructokinase [Brevibacillus nitrificans]|uniref:1-phosphofructokinase n=1 Tax=Brevibacillus nitrificans TaxID=651560 RepID=UPI00285CE45F|nr:1-phosphofructokinase [Brevibacillus nitrificans]MDR7313798.1 1-phosphofructokinase [Brevibacillus nitrificans]